MYVMAGSGEIVESPEELDCEAENDQKNKMARQGLKYSIEDDINKLFEAIDIKNTRKVLCQSDYSSKDVMNKSAMKRPMRVGPVHSSGIGISESVSLKQALRGLCISQASEMAAMKKRLPRSTRSSGVSEVRTIKRLYRAVVVESNESGHPLNEGKGNLMEISLVPECSTSSSFIGNMLTPEKEECTDSSAVISSLSSGPCTEEAKVRKPLPKDEIDRNKIMKAESSTLGVISPETEVPIKPMTDKEREGKLHPASCSSVVHVGSKASKSAANSPLLKKPLFRSKNFVKKKLMASSSPICSGQSQCSGGANNDCCTSEVVGQTPDSTPKNVQRDTNKISPETTSSSGSSEFNSKYVGFGASKNIPTTNNFHKTKNIVSQADERSRTREKGEMSQSSKSSVGDYSSTTSISEESYLSSSNRSGHRPHMSTDLRLKAIHSVQKQYGNLGFKHFKMLKKLGGGDIGNVYLSELIGTNCLFALKVMDNDFLTSRKKMPRAQTEREILQMLDHPFLPLLYTHFKTDKYSCLVIEYCPGGDLHVLRQKQPTKSFSEQAARYILFEDRILLKNLLLCSYGS